MSTTTTQTSTMRAVNYQGPFSVKVEEVPMPVIEHPDDVIVKVTTAAICGSDLHMYEGRTGAQAGITFGMHRLTTFISVSAPSFRLTPQTRS